MKIYIAADQMITSAAVGTGGNFDALLNGRSGVRKVDNPALSGSPVMCGYISANVYEALAEKYGYDLSRTELLAVASVNEMLLGLSGDRIDKLQSSRVGMVIATAKGDISAIEGRCNAGQFIPGKDDPVLLGGFAKKLAWLAGIPESDVYLVSNACISGVTAIIVARRLILSGQYDSVIVVGVDTQNRFITSGFASFKSLSGELCRPYDGKRCGLNLGEASGAMLLTADYGLAGNNPVSIDGGAATDDANHISGPSRTGDGLYFAMRRAMSETGLDPSDIDAMQMHGTATAYNDEMESKAAGLAGLQNIPVQSLKPYFGHTMGASGVIETIMLAEQMKHGVFFGVKGFEHIGVPVELNVSAENREIPMRHCIKTASGFGGTNAAIVLTYDLAGGISGQAAGENGGAKSLDRSFNHLFEIAEPEAIRTVRIVGGRVKVDDNEVFAFAGPYPDFIRAAFKAHGGDYMKFYKMDDYSRLVFVASEWLLDGISLGEEDCGIVMSGMYGSLDTDMKHQHIIDTEGEDKASPSVFVYTLPNVAGAEIAIRHHIKGENTWFCSADRQMSDIKRYAAVLMAAGHLKYCIIGHADYINGEYFCIFTLCANIDSEIN